MDFTRQKATNYDQDVRDGKIPGVSFVRLSAVTSDLNSVDEVVGAVGTNFDFNYALASESWRIKSADANDTFGGTGIQTVDIIAVIDDFTVETKTLNLNGTSFVSVPVDNNVFPSQLVTSLCDPGNFAAGDITLETVGGDVRGVIIQGSNNSSDGVDMVPGGFKWDLKNAVIGSGKGTDGTFFLQRTRDVGIWIDVATISIYQGVVSIPISTISIPEKSLVRIVGSSSNDNSAAILELVFYQVAI